MKPSKNPHLIGVVEALVVVACLGVGCDRHPPAGRTPQDQVPLVVPSTNMVLVKAGSFTRMNQRIMLTRDFWLGRSEVTQGEYEALTGKNPSHFTGNPDLPVEKISHVDAVTYCAMLTRRERDSGRLPPGYAYRLPSEAEWEYACRAGSTNFFNFGDDASAADQYAWTEENSDGTTHPVGQKRPNAWGLHDMHGNVWEWCQDWFAEFPATGATDPVGPAAGEFKVFRGGGWSHAAKFARCGNRFMMAPVNGIYFVGFRVALAPTPVPSP